MTKIVLAAAVLALGLTAVGASAASAEDRVRVAARVPLRAVDFRQPESVQAFYTRLERAASDVCNSHVNEFDALEADAACKRATLDAAVAKLSKPVLTAMHQTQSENRYARGF
jgi:UrcA family protein